MDNIIQVKFLLCQMPDFTGDILQIILDKSIAILIELLLNPFIKIHINQLLSSSPERILQFKVILQFHIYLFLKDCMGFIRCVNESLRESLVEKIRKFKKLDILIKSIDDTQKVLGDETSILIGVPIPGKLSRENISLGLSNDTDERLAFEISTFILNIEAIHNAVKTEVVNGGKPVFGVGIRIIEETRIEIFWKEYPVFKERIIILDSYDGE